MTKIEERGDNPQLNERLWQAWIFKNRKLDKAYGARRLRLLEVGLLIVVAVTILQKILS